MGLGFTIATTQKKTLLKPQNIYRQAEIAAFVNSNKLKHGGWGYIMQHLQSLILTRLVYLEKDTSLEICTEVNI